MVEKNDYSNTLNLPKTEFKMRADFSKRASLFVHKWNTDNIYKKICNKNKNNKRFILHDGPPYANAHIHLGTGLNKVIKDFIVKYLSMSGYSVPFVPGWDCHGLPIEQVVLRDLRANKNQINKIFFRNQAENFVNKFVAIQKQEFQDLGVIADWDNSYLTLNKTYESCIINLFRELVINGFIYRKNKPVYWCTVCETAMAEAEVEYKLHRTKSIFLKFNITSLPNNNIFSQYNTLLKDFAVLIWTTTPWSLPANVALAFNGESNYIFAIYKFTNVKEEKLIVAKSLAYNIQKQIKSIGFKIILEVKGKELTNIICQNPLLPNKLSQCVIASFVSTQDGTGIVHIAPGLGQEDYQVGLEYGFEIFSPIDSKGAFTKDISEFEGMNIFKANDIIIKKLCDTKKILALLNIEHSYPYCWRCKQPIIFRATPQWFLSMDHRNLRSRILNVLNTIKWIPEYGKNRMISMLKNRPDWCLSRQRLWGVPLPIFYCNKCSHPILNLQVINRIAEIFYFKGSNAWFEMSESELLKGLDIQCTMCKSTEFRKEQDILDVWFDSGASFEAVLSNKFYYTLHAPADLYLEGSDQHRGWFQTSLILSMATKDTIPYKTVLTHGFVVDGEGKKMSKSLGNFVSNDIMLHKYGADMMRFWIASSNYKEDIKLSDEIMQVLGDMYRKIRNTIRFLLGNIYDLQSIVPFQKLKKIDQYALNELNKLIQSITTYYNDYTFHKVMSNISKFCTVFLSGFYLNALKDTLYCDKQNSCTRVSAQSAMYEICSVIIRLLAPVLSFTAEEAWQEMIKLNNVFNNGNESSVFLSNFPIVNSNYHLNESTHEIFTKMFYIRKLFIHNYETFRKLHKLSSTLETAITITYGKNYDEVFNDISLLNIVLGSWDIKYKLSLDKEDELNIVLSRSKYQKCNRCWRYIDNIKNGLCLRCTQVISSFKYNNNV
jgi:isoleucyl-tRNA synthetase